MWGGGASGLWSDGRLELPSPLEEPSGNFQMTHIIQNSFHGMELMFIFLFFPLRGVGGWCPDLMENCIIFRCVSISI